MYGAAELLLADHAFAPAVPGFAGVAVTAALLDDATAAAARPAAVRNARR